MKVGQLMLVTFAVIAVCVAIPSMSDESDAADVTFDLHQTFTEDRTINMVAGDTLILNKYYSSTLSFVYRTYIADEDIPSWLTDDGVMRGQYTGQPSVGEHQITVTEHRSRINGGSSTDETYTLTIIVSANVTFYANGGTFNDGSEVYTPATSGEMVLPAVSWENHTMIGWYDNSNAEGESVGMPGESFTPEPGKSYYACWKAADLVIDTWPVYGNQGLTFTHSPEVRDANGDVIEDFSLSYDSAASDETGCIVTGDNEISVNLYGLLPGTYHEYFNVTATVNGEVMTGTWEVIIYQTVFVIEDPEGRFEVGDTFRDSIPVKPDNAQAISYTVELDGSVASPSYYDISGIPGTTISFTAERAGVWTINLILSAPGLAADYNYSFNLVYYEAEDPEPDVPVPEILDIDYVKVEGSGSENTYMFYVSVSTQVDSIEWNFGDGEYASGNNQTHVFRSIGNFTVTCTVKNSAGSDSEEVDILADDVIENPDFRGQANINTEYRQEFYIDSPAPLVSFTSDTLTESQMSWLQYEVVQLGDRYALVISGICTDATQAGHTIHVEVRDSSQVWEWDIMILPQVDDDPEPNQAHAEYTADGLSVTLTNINPSDLGIMLIVDWGDGDISMNSSASTFVHTYPRSGTWDVTLTWRYDSTQFTYPLTIEVEGAAGRVVYHGGEGAEGTMDPQEGQSSYIVLDCGFTNGDKEFRGWSSTPDLLGTIYMPGDEVFPSGTLDLYAIWTGSDSGGIDDLSEPQNILTIIACVAIVALIIILVARYLI